MLELDKRRRKKTKSDVTGKTPQNCRCRRDREEQPALIPKDNQIGNKCPANVMTRARVDGRCAFSNRDRPVLTAAFFATRLPRSGSSRPTPAISLATIPRQPALAH